MKTHQRFMQVMLALLQAKGFDASVVSGDEVKNIGASGANNAEDACHERKNREQHE